MRIVDRKTFLALPQHTLFSKWVPCAFDALRIKGKSLEDDFFEQQIEDAVMCNDSEEFADLCDIAANTGESIDLDFDCQGRDGCHDPDQMFAVWEAADVLALIERLGECVPQSRLTENTDITTRQTPTKENHDDR